MEDEYMGASDPTTFTKQLRECWECVPQTSFGELLELVFDGYNPNQLTAQEMEESMNDFILQNQ